MAVLVMLLLCVAIALADDETGIAPYCEKKLMKYIQFNICRQKELASQCLTIETDHATALVDKCYRKLGIIDPLNTVKTIDSLCSYEEFQTQTIQCLCEEYRIFQENRIEKRMRQVVEDMNNENVTEDTGADAVFYDDNDIELDGWRREFAAYADDMMRCFYYLSEVNNKYYKD